MTTVRHRSIAVAIAAAATLGLTACQDSAPPVAGPSSTSSNSSDSSPSSSSSESSTSSSSDTSSSTSSETSSDTSSSTSASEQPGQCYNSYSVYYSKKTSDTKIVSYGTKAETNDSNGVEVTPSKGEPKEAGSSYPYDGDKQALLFNIKFKLKPSSSFAVLSYLNLTLRDEAGNVCERDSSSSFVAADKKISVKSLNSSSPDFDGQIVFVVPKGKDYSKYTLLYSPESSKDFPAPIGWEG